MNRVFEGLARVLWRMVGPVRRPLSRRLGRWVAEAVRGQIAPVLHEVHASRRSADVLAEETNLLLDSVVRELTRLERRVESLQEAVEEGEDRAARGGLALAGGPD